MNRRALLIIFAVALLVIATTWLSEKTETPTTRPEQAAELTDYFIKDFEATVTSANGLPSHRMQSDALTHYADSGIVELRKPQLTIYRPQGEKWQVQAEQGRMTGDGNEVTLRGKVVLKQQSKKQPLQVKTDRLHLFPDRQYGETDTPVTITAQGGRLTGVGMEVYGKENRLLLLSDVRGHYDSTVR